MQPTRWEILQLLKRRGRATVDELAKALGLTLMGVRLHLVVVERDGYVRRSTVRHKPGRPALVYSLTPKAEDIFPKRYDVLAETLLDVVGGGGVSPHSEEPLAAVARRMAAPLKGGLDTLTVEQRVERVACLLDEIGAFASSEKTDGGYLIHQFNCLFYKVARRHREVCSVDGIVLEELLGVKAQHRECIFDGAGRCSHFVPDETEVLSAEC